MENVNTPVDHREEDSQALAAAETHLAHVLTNQTPPQDPGSFELTEAARDFHATTGSWDVAGADTATLLELLGRHTR